MGQCGCGEMNVVRLFRTKGSETIIAVDFYRGCEDCGNPIDVTLRFFDKKGYEDMILGWHDPELEIEEVEGDEFGGRNGVGWNFPILGKAEIVAKAKEIDVDLESYDSLADVLSDHGTELLQGAVYRLRHARRPATPSREQPPVATSPQEDESAPNDLGNTPERSPQA